MSVAARFDFAVDNLFYMEVDVSLAGDIGQRIPFSAIYVPMHLAILCMQAQNSGPCCAARRAIPDKSIDLELSASYETSCQLYSKAGTFATVCLLKQMVANGIGGL